jgi:hypothetical protein
MKRIELGYAQVYFEAPVFYIIFCKNAELGFFEIRELNRTAQELSGQKPYYTFADARAGVRVTPQGRKIASDASEAPYHRGTALLVNSKVFELAANFFGTIARPPYPFRAFTEYDKALAWLGSMPAQVMNAGDKDAAGRTNAARR